MNFLRFVRHALAAAIAFLIVLAIYISHLVVRQQESLAEASRYNVTWNVSQGVIEAMRLEHRIAAMAVPNSGVDLDEVQLRFDILSNRLSLLRRGDIEAFLDSDPDRRAVADLLGKALAEIEPLLARLQEPGVVQQALDILEPLEAKLVGLAAAANIYGGALAAADMDALIRLHWYFSYSLFGLVLCAFILLGFLFKQNQVLRAQESELRTQNLRVDMALNNMARGLCMFDAEERLIVNNALFLSVLGLPAGAVHAGMRLDAIVAAGGAAESADAASVFGAQAPLIEERRPGDFEQKLSDDRILAVHHQPMADGGWVATYEDVTERRRAEARIAHMARHDSLTQLPNRLMFRERAAHALAALGRGGQPVAVLCVGLDQFKSVNETLGHPVGDMLLRTAAQRLAGCVREADTVARLGGDEFAIIQMAPVQPHHAALLAQRILDLLSAPYDLDGHEVVIGASIGIAVGPGDGRNPDELLRNADVALYRAKSDGRGTYRFFEPHMDAQIQTRRQLELDLRHALVNGEFELHYQPLVDILTGATVGFEALLRWQHPQRGMVSPGTFIPLAEEIGLIQPIGEWVIRRACEQAASWPQDLTVAVNLSPLQFKGRKLVETVVSALAMSRLGAERLELEVTESVVLEDSEATRATLERLHEIGVRVALDDFGTGYSSLSCLRTFPFDKVKIDQSFVREMTQREDCAAIVRAVIALAGDLGMTITAEGVETQEQRELLQAEGCGQAQGYLFSRPLGPLALADWLRRGVDVERYGGSLTPRRAAPAIAAAAPALPRCQGA